MVGLQALVKLVKKQNLKTTIGNFVGDHYREPLQKNQFSLKLENEKSEKSVYEHVFKVMKEENV